MSDFLSSLTHSTGGLKAQATRLRHISENIANADTPGYRRKTVPFSPDDTTLGIVKTGTVRLDQTTLEKVYDPTHPMADDAGYFDGSNVNLLIEITAAREAQRSYEANLKMFDQARQMSASLLELLRR